MLLITGTQRSGTTLMAKFIRECGYDIDGYCDSIGGYEDFNIAAEFRRLTGEPTFPFKGYQHVNNPIPLSKYEPKVAKFSYLLMDPQFVFLWHQQRGHRFHDKFIIMYRPAWQVVKSKSQHPEFLNDCKLLHQTEATLARNRMDAMANLRRRYGYETWSILFPEITFSQVKRALTWGGLNLPDDAEVIWNNCYDHSKVTING